MMDAGNTMSGCDMQGLELPHLCLSEALLPARALIDILVPEGQQSLHCITAIENLSDAVTSCAVCFAPDTWLTAHPRPAWCRPVLLAAAQLRAVLLLPRLCTADPWLF